MHVEAKLQSMGLALPATIQLPPSASRPFAWARAFGDRVYISGHGPLDADGSMLLPIGKVGAEVSLEQARIATRAATLAALSSLKRLIGNLDRVSAWLSVSGMVNVAPGFVQTSEVINACSELLLELYGPEIGGHARTAIGMAQLPRNVAVVISAEVAIHL